jgi:hypothetical protein
VLRGGGLGAAGYAVTRGGMEKPRHDSGAAADMGHDS